MNVPGTSEGDVDRTYRTLNKDATDGGYHLNPDAEFVKNLVRGLLKNEQRYGYQACPCRLASGKKEEDLDIICPCDYRDADLDEHGACYCALYVDEAIAGGSRTVVPVPERRPPRSERGRPRRWSTPPLQGRLRCSLFRFRYGGARSAGTSAHGSSPLVSVLSARQKRTGSSGLSETVVVEESVSSPGSFHPRRSIQ